MNPVYSNEDDQHEHISTISEQKIQQRIKELTDNIAGLNEHPANWQIKEQRDLAEFRSHEIRVESNRNKSKTQMKKRETTLYDQLVPAVRRKKNTEDKSRNHDGAGEMRMIGTNPVLGRNA